MLDMNVIIIILLCAYAVGVTSQQDSVQDCLTYSDVRSIKYDGNQVDILSACAALDAGNYVPFASCGQGSWIDTSNMFLSLFDDSARVFIGLEDHYRTNEYDILSDGAATWSGLFDDMFQNDNDTRKACVAINIPPIGTKSWTLRKASSDKSKYYFICEGPGQQCLDWFNIATYNTTLCSKLNSPDNLKTIKDAIDDCRSTKGTLPKSSIVYNLPVITQIAEQYLQRSKEKMVGFWMSDYVAIYGRNLQLERVKCEYRDGDKFLCMKPKPQYKDAQSYRGCSRLPPDTSSSYALSSPHMQVGYCAAVCGAKRATYAGIRGQECHCLSSELPDTDEICSVTCPGRPGQACGGNNSISMYNKKFYGAPIKTCEGYYRMGFYPPANTSVGFETAKGTVNCSMETMFPPTSLNASCPPGFFQILTSCFYFETDYLTKSSDAQRWCQTMRSDLASFENIRTLKLLRSILRRPYTFSKFNYWHLGGYHMASNLNWTWRNGKPFHGFNLSTQLPEAEMDYCLIYKLRMNDTIVELVSVQPCENEDNYASICAYNQQFLGFHPWSSSSEVVYVSKWMTVSTCIQLCLNATRSQFAQVLNDSCSCLAAETQINSQNSYSCLQPNYCPAHRGQICGCDGVNASVYLSNVSTAVTFESCLQLQQYGVRTNGVYQLSQNSKYFGEFCNFTTEDACTGRPAGYVSYRGLCYRLGISNAKTVSEAQDTCNAEGATLANPRDEDEINFYQYFVKKMSNSSENDLNFWIGTTATPSLGRSHPRFARHMMMGDPDCPPKGKMGMWKGKESCDQSFNLFICQYGKC